MADTKFVRQKKEKNYTVLDNTFIKDCNLSWKAKGLMSYLLSLPDDWTIFQSELETHAKDGIDSLRSAIKELKENGYLEKTQNNNNGRFAGYSYKIYEVPCGKNRIGKTVSEKPKSENPTLLNTDFKQNTNKQNTITPSNEGAKKKNSKAPLFDEIDTFTNNNELKEIIKKWLTMILKTSRNFELDQLKIQLENLSKVKDDEKKIEIVKRHYSNNYRSLIYENEIPKEEQLVKQEETEFEKQMGKLFDEYNKENGIERGY